MLRFFNYGFYLFQMEGLVREMQDPENGVPVRSQKLFLTSIPSAFMGKYFHIVTYLLTYSFYLSM